MSARRHYGDEDRIIAALVGLAIIVVIVGIAAVIEDIRRRVIWW
jgi:hypothetical protein